MTTATPDDGLHLVGERLRAARTEQGLTLQQLAADTDISASTLSRLEAGKRKATLELLLPLVRRLGIRLDDLLPTPPADPRVRRATERRGGMLVAPLTLEHSSVQAYKIVYPVRDGLPEPRVHDGFEWFYVLSGSIRLLLGGVEHTIAAGEAAEFDTRVAHAISAVGERPAEVISIFSAAGERIHTRAG